MNMTAVAAIATFLAASAAHAAPSPSRNSSAAQGSATVTVFAPIVLTHDDDAVLSFGTFTVGTGGTVTVDSSGAGKFGGDVGEVSGSSTSADAFWVEGDPGRGFSIMTTGGAVTNGTDKMAFTTAPSTDADKLDGKGRARFTVGGELRIAGTESAGKYTGSYNTTVAYN